MTIRRLLIILAIFLFGIGFAKHFKMDLKSMESIQNVKTVSKDKPSSKSVLPQ